ncbi:hypothetical protein GQX73_g811 [Xylaria multiplex]|uniref:EthD domain-containing protein n=1 Tax=Xylaria multiplex TaxID=323545 RepID=A0A7C8IUU8_9PEZI|nr:hypothetical protein GQX73_g811 [Xylaria multiplex]
MSSPKEHRPAVPHSEGQFLCVTICGYKKAGVSDEDYHHYMAQVSAPLARDLMMKYGIVRWTQIYNTTEIRATISQLYDPTLTQLADFDMFSQVVFKKLEDFKKFKQDPIYKTRLTARHDNFIDTKRSMMTIGSIEQYIDRGNVVDGVEDSEKSATDLVTVFSLTAGCFLSGIMMGTSLLTIPAFLDTAHTADQLCTQWARLYHYGVNISPSISVATFLLYVYAAVRNWFSCGSDRWSFVLAGVVTAAMIPFTWIIMMPTNDKLFALEAEAQAGHLTASLEHVRALVTEWNLMHMLRSSFPLAGALIGFLMHTRK